MGQHPMLPPSTKASSRKLSGRFAFSHAGGSANSGSRTVVRAIEEYHQHRDDAPNAAANASASYEAAHYDLGGGVDFLAAESSVGGIPLRHRYGGCGKTYCAAPSKP